MARFTLGVVPAFVLALVTGCAHGPVTGAIPEVAGPPMASSQQGIVARAFDVHTGAAAKPPMFMMPTPNYFDDGYTPSVTFVKNGTLFEEHSSGRGYLWYHVGNIYRATATWGQSQKVLVGGSQDDGVEPAVTGDGNGIVFEAHRGGSTSEKIYARFGKYVNINNVTWGKSEYIANGYDPSVAFSGPNVILEAHADGDGLGKWNVGTVAGGAVTWRSNGSLSDAFRPSLAANARGTALDIERDVAPYRTVGEIKYYHLAYRVGRVDANAGTVSWSGRHVIDPASTILSSRVWSAALDDAGNVILLYSCDKTTYYAGKDVGYGWCTMTGKLESNVVRWVGDPILSPPFHYFAELLGLGSPSVALQNGIAVGVADQGARGLYYGTTMLTDRSNWMGDRLDTTLKGKTLRKIVFPASHDAGMYTGNLGKAGVAQSQNFYEQLTGGQRYFDIRPDTNLNAWHGPGEGCYVEVTGASIKDILNDVKRYMQEGHREVVILKFSHFECNFFSTDKLYNRLKTMILDALGPWLYDNEAVHKGTVRLADIPLSTMIPKDKGIVLPVVDLPSTYAGTGSGFIYSYRDWDSTIDHSMQFTVYDQYSNTTLLDKMQSDQLVKFYHFNGKMQSFPAKPCDLFLLSWTLTPAVAIRASAAEADATLKPLMSVARTNPYGFVPNILFLDYYSWADPADLAIVENALQ